MKPHPHIWGKTVGYVNDWTTPAFSLTFLSKLKSSVCHGMEDSDVYNSTYMVITEVSVWTPCLLISVIIKAEAIILPHSSDIHKAACINMALQRFRCLVKFTGFQRITDFSNDQTCSPLTFSFISDYKVMVEVYVRYVRGHAQNMCSNANI